MAKLLYSAQNLAKMLMARGFSKPQRLRPGELVSGNQLNARGGRMRNFLIVMVAAMCLGTCLATGASAQNVDWHAQQKQKSSA